MQKFLAFLFLLALPISFAYAGGFEVWQQSGESVGDYAAGAAAEAEDATTAFYNPAGLIRIKHQDAAFSAIAHITNIKFKGSITPTSTISDFTNNSGIAQGGGSRVLPTLFYAAPISDKWGFGFSMSSPFDLDVEYGRNEFTRYVSTRNDIRLVDLGPSLAFKPFKYFSFGAGFDAQHIHMDFNQMDNITSSVANDALSKSEMADWAFGWNMGVLVELPTNTRIGLSYRTKVNHHADGTTKCQGMKLRVKTHLKLPPITIFSVYQQVTPQWSLMGTVNYTQWSSVRNFILKNVATPSGPTNITIQEDFKNTWLLSIGTHYQLNKEITLRTGLGYDPTPTKNSTRNIDLPDCDNYIISAGLGYQMTSTLSFDFGYTHVFSKHSPINKTQSYGADTIHSLGMIDRSEDILGLQLNWLMT